PLTPHISLFFHHPHHHPDLHSFPTRRSSDLERHIAFMRGADLVIHDAQYTEEEYRDKVGWGHSPLEYAVDVALAAGARRLVLFHHDPQHDDAATERMESAARARAAAHGAGPAALARRAGLALAERGPGPARAARAAPAPLPRPVAR